MEICTPNPANNVVSVSYNLNNKDIVAMSLFDIKGKLITTVINNEIQQSGNYEYKVSLNNLDKGIYLILLQRGKQISVSKILKY